MTDNEIMEKFKQYFDTNGQISIENGLVSCSGDVELRDKKISTIPLKFKEVGGDFDCNGCELTSLIGAPQSVGGSFDCSYNQFRSLAGAPQSVGGGFYCSSNGLTSLLGAPQYVHTDFYCINNPLASLAGAPQYVGEDLLLTYRSNLALLPLLMIKGCKQVNFAHIYHDDYHYDNGSLSEILNRYLGTGTQGMLPCADEMIEAGYGSNAHYD